jgi:hypothetical protein
MPSTPHHLANTDVAENDWFASNILLGVDTVQSSTDRTELWNKMRALNWKKPSLQDLLETTAFAHRIARDFIIQKHLKRSWKQCRQLIIGGKRPRKPSNDEKAVWEYKLCEASVLGVFDDGTCAVKVMVGPCTKEYRISQSMLFDVKYVTAHDQSFNY